MEMVEMVEMVGCNGWPFWASVLLWFECISLKQKTANAWFICRHALEGQGRTRLYKHRAQELAMRHTHCKKVRVISSLPGLAQLQK